ncbi:MAG: heavy metal-binding domain-containing protein [Acidimicrobiales bacterium]
MLIVTMNDVPGYRITKVIGEVNGLTVRTRNVGAQIGAGLKALAGGELKGLTKQLQQSRAEALERLSEAATAAGANAVIAMRYDSNELANTFQEILAYGTAVVVEPA